MSRSSKSSAASKPKEAAKAASTSPSHVGASGSHVQEADMESGRTGAKNTAVEVANDTALRDVESNADVSQERNIETGAVDSRESLEAPADNDGDVERL